MGGGGGVGGGVGGVGGCLALYMPVNSYGHVVMVASGYIS